MFIPIEDVHSRWGTFPFHVRHIPIPCEAHTHSRWGCAFPVRHIPIPCEAHPHFRWGCAVPVRHIPIPCEAHPHLISGEYVHSRWGTSPFPVRHIHISGEDVHSWWVTSPFLVRTCILGEAYPYSQRGVNVQTLVGNCIYCIIIFSFLFPAPLAGVTNLKAGPQGRQTLLIEWTVSWLLLCEQFLLSVCSPSPHREVWSAKVFDTKWACYLGAQKWKPVLLKLPALPTCFFAFKQNKKFISSIFWDVSFKNNCSSPTVDRFRQNLAKCAQ